MPEKTAVLSIDGDTVQVTGESLAHDRRARLFFRSFLGATAVPSGWACPKRRHSIRALLLQVYDWLDRNGYEVRSEGDADLAVSREIERRRSFTRTKETAAAFKDGSQTFDFKPVEDALAAFGWSDQRNLQHHQREGTAHALIAINAANFSVPGSGKTATTLAVAATHLHAGTIDAIVVIGPLASFDPWEGETAAAVGTRIRARRVRGIARARLEAYSRTRKNDLLLLSYATAATDQAVLLDLFDRWRVMLVVDESHRIKRFRGGLWAPAISELARRARVRLLLSGTPMPQSGLDLYSQLGVLWPDGQLTGTRDAFAARVANQFPKVIADILPFVSRTPKAALGLDPPVVQRHEVPLAETQAQIYEMIANRFRRDLQDAASWRAKLDALKRGRPIRLLQAAANPDVLNSADSYYRLPPLETTPTLMQRLAHYREVETPAKASAAVDLIRTIAGRGGKVVCWSNFIRNLDYFTALVRDRLGLPCFQIDGRVPAGIDSLHADPMQREEDPAAEDTREAIISRFLDASGPAVLTANPASCSESISLHKSCHHAIYLDRTYDAALYLQSIDRIHRLGLPAGLTVEVHILLGTVDDQPTIDHLVDQSLEAKADTMRRLLEGAELAPINLADDPSIDAEGNTDDLAALLRYLLGEVAS